MNQQMKFHIGLHVSDIEKTIGFYTDLFGEKPVKVKDDYAKFELDNPSLVISFIKSEKVAAQFGHLGLRVNSSDELAERKQQIERKLDLALEEENTNCCYAMQDKFWVNDPDGYEWEVYHIKEDTEPKRSDKSLVACC